MMRPTLRAVLLFSATVPPAFVLLAWKPELWAISFDLGLFVLALLGIDALLCIRFRELDVAYDMPARLFIGSGTALNLMIAQRGKARAVTFEALLEQRGE